MRFIYLKNNFKKIIENVLDDDKRRNILFRWLNFILSAVSLIMSLINIMTHEYILFLATVVFAILCIINSAYKGKTFKSLIYVVFGAEALILLAFFLISGIPDGFSALWICLIPSFTLLIFGIKIRSLCVYDTVSLFIFYDLYSCTFY